MLRIVRIGCVAGLAAAVLASGVPIQGLPVETTLERWLAAPNPDAATETGSTGAPAHAEGQGTVALRAPKPDAIGDWSNGYRWHPL